MKGIITITKRDAATMEVVEEQTVENIFTQHGYMALMRGLAIQGTILTSDPRGDDDVFVEEAFEQNGSNFGFGVPQTGEVILSENPVVADVSTLYKLQGIIQGTPLNNPYTTFIRGTTGSPVVADIAELAYRFGAPVSPRTIRTIAIGQGPNFSTTEYGIIAYAALSTPCTQGVTEILDVTYRLFFNDVQINDVSGRSITFDTPSQVAFGACGGNQLDAYHFFNAEYQWHKTPPADTFFTLSRINRYGEVQFTLREQSSSLGAPRYIDHRRLRSRVSEDITTGNLKGRILRSIVHGDTDTNIGASDPFYRRSTSLVHPAFDDSFANKPIQVIHNHSVDAIEPFLDVDFLATGSGQLAANGDNWTAPDFPEYYRVDIQSSGNVGTSTYSFAKRKLVNGFAQDTFPNGNVVWRTVPEPFPWVNNDRGNNPLYDPALRNDVAPNGPLRGFNNVYNSVNTDRVQGNIEPYSDDDHIILFDTDEVGIININDGAIAYFYGSIGSPAVDINPVIQVAADNDGSLWIASTTGGLVKITDPLGTPVITQMTNAINGIPSGSDNLCYGVSRGFGGSIWAVFEGAIGQTTDGGTTWTLYNDTTGGSPVDFVYTSNGGITNGNWGQVRWLRVDESSPDNEMAIMYYNAADAADVVSICWWSTATPAVYGNQYDGLLSSNKGGRGRTGCVRCSRTGHQWLIESRSTSTTYPVIAAFGSTARTLSAGGNSLHEENTSVGFYYDYYGNPYYMSASRQTNSRAAMYLDSVEISRMWGFDTLTGAAPDFRYNGAIFAINENEGRGSVGLWGLNGFNQFDWSIGQVSPSDDIVSDWRPATGGAEANWNGKDTPFEEFVWRRYNYKSVGSPIGWIEGYHFPATDTSGRGIDGIRENFETENHRFRGRSSIDISASAGATFAGSPQTWTAAFTVVEPETKTAIHDGDTRQCLLSGLDNGVTTFKFFLDDGSGNVAIDSFGTTQTFGSTPAFGGSPAVSTLVLSVDGNQATCYLDGVQLGSTLTIDPQSLENVSGDLELRVGASVYHEDAGGNFLRRIKDFYLGRLRNVQLWNSAWDATDASNHQASPFGVIGSEPIGNLEARFELNPTGSPAQDLTGLETKPTHVSFDDLDNGITLSFGAGSPLGNFVATDFYSFGAVDGLLKDNAVSYTFNAHFYHTESQNNFSEIEDTINSPGVSGSPASAVVPASGGQVTEPVTWRISSSTDFLDTVFLKRPGQIGATNTSNAFASCNQIGFQYIDTTGGYFEARPAQAFGEMYLGLTDSTSASNTAMDYSFYLKSDGTYDVRQLNVVPGGGPSSVTYTEGDLFRITRVSGSPDTIEYRVNNVLVYTSTVAPTGNLSPAWATTFNGADGMAAAYDCSINWNRPANILDVGDSLVSTGKYDPTFYCFDSIGGSVVIGSPEVEMQLTNNLNDRLLDIAPVPGEVVMVGDTGHLVFNAADQGLPVRCSLTLLKQD